MRAKFENLMKLGAGGIDHIDGSLIEHLKGTKQLLIEWGSSVELQDAGLYHAAYGTDGFDERLISTEQREKIAEIIGHTAEGIVYEYCACDRDDFFAKIGEDTHPQFKNRFTKKKYCLSESMLRSFCELTAANEIEIAIDNSDFLKQYGEELNHLFNKMAPYLSPVAREKAAKVFGACNA